MVRQFIRSLPDAPDDERTVPRIRAHLEALGRPDVRYLVGLIRGAGSQIVGRYARGVLEAAGASVHETRDALDDPLLARAGTAVAAMAYQLNDLRPELGELSRRDAEALLVFVAAAEASRRVLLLVDAVVTGAAPVLGAMPDLVAFADVPDDLLRAAVGDVPDDRPVILAPRPLPVVEELTDIARARRVVLIAGGRDFLIGPAAAGLDLAIGDERYAGLALRRGDDPRLAATGIVVALGLGTLGVRMRPEWVEQGARLAAARE